MVFSISRLNLSTTGEIDVPIQSKDYYIYLSNMAINNVKMKILYYKFTCPPKPVECFLWWRLLFKL